MFVPLGLTCLICLEMISPSFVCLNSSGIVRILFSCELDWIEFAVLCLFLDLAQRCCACFRFILFSRSFSFLADPVPFFFFSCLV